MPPQKRTKMNGNNARKNPPQLAGVSKLCQPNQLAKTTSESAIGAPTSLTNLAQLSGLTIVPVSSMTQASRKNVPTIPQRINIRPVQPQLIRQSASNNNFIVTTGPHQQSSASNASILPSIQLINPRDLSAEKSMPRNFHLGLNLHSEPTRNNRSTAALHAADDHHLGHYNGAVGRFVNEPSDYNNEASSAYTIDDLHKLAQRSAAASPTTEDQSADMSLIRLMEIFNNPALTITPVESTRMRDTNNRSSRDRPEARGIAQSGLIHSQTKPSNGSKARIPKSAANLQLLSGRSELVHQNDQFDGVPQGFEQPTIEVQEANSSLEDSQAALDWLSSLAVSRIQDESSSVTLSWVPAEVGLGGNINNETQREGNFPGNTRTQTMSVQLLHQLASQAEASNTALKTDDSIADEPPTFEPECLITIPRVDVRQLAKEARDRETVYSVRVNPDNLQKRGRLPLRTSKRRLWDPRVEESVDHYNGLAPIEIETVEEKEFMVSERHLMLEGMLGIANTLGQRELAPIEPDDIFVNRSKRIMSTIDTTMERKKRKRFESICDRSACRDASEKAVSYDSDDSDNSDVSEQSTVDESINLFEMTVVPIQLPLDEGITDQKREHLSSVGLISRNDKVKLSIQRCEDRLRNISALALEETSEGISEDTQRFIDMISQTGGIDIQLRTETDIKRNELPFIEGLNRNTSRIKMGYMSALGLDKRSKRTTLYRVTKTKDLNQVQAPKQQQQKQQQQQEQRGQRQQPQQSQNTQQPNDLISKPQQLTPSAMNQGRVTATRAKNPELANRSSNSQLNFDAADMIAKAVRLAQASCREAMHAPNKDDYMKSLGLTAS